MTTSKQDRKDRFFKPVKEGWETTKERLDENPRRTAIWMAVILFVAFSVFMVRTVYRYRHPAEKKNVELMRTVDDRFLDSMSVRKTVTDDLTEYFMLLKIQEELEEMNKNPEKADTARVNELIKKLSK
jgi:hypothetical protein